MSRTRTVGASVTFEGEVDFSAPDVEPWKHQRVAFALEKLCTLTGHFGACAVLNGRMWIGGHKLPIPIPTARLWNWATR